MAKDKNKQQNKQVTVPTATVPGESLPPGLELPDEDHADVVTTSEGATDGDEMGTAPDTSDADDAIPEVTREPQDDETDPEAPDDPATVPSGSVGRTRGYQRRINKPEGYIIRKGEPLTFPGKEVSGGVLTTQDVLREIIVRGSKTPTYTLLYRKGTLVAKTALNKIL